MACVTSLLDIIIKLVQPNYHFACLVQNQFTQYKGLKVSSSIKKGRPEEIIIQMTRETKADLIAIWSREGAAGHPRFRASFGSGNTAQFVVDHSPCDVLLLLKFEI